MERKHFNVAPENGVCLADYCEVFEVCHGESRWKPKRDKTECNQGALTKIRHKCEIALQRCFPLDVDASRKMHAEISRHYCQVLDCRIRAEKRRDEEEEMIPVIALLIMILLICFIVFTIVVCCVDYSDSLFQFLVDSRIVSVDFVRGALQTRDKARSAAGLPRTKRV
jgi:hypothetical protein